MALTHLDCVRKMPLMPLPVRGTVIPLSNGRVLYGAGSTLSREQLASAGAITDIVVPNLLHSEGAVLAAQVHPSARLWGPAGIEQKQPALKWSVIGRDSWPYEDELPAIALAGQPSMNELVLAHRPSKTLLVGDLMFHHMDAEGLGARIILGLFGTWKKAAVSRLFLASVKDKPAFTRSLEQVFALDFDKVVPSHGTTVDDGKTRLRAALAERGYNL